MADVLSSPLLEEEEEDNDISNHEVASRENIRLTDLDSIASFQQLIKESWVESKKLWKIAGPAIFSSLCSYSILLITSICAGHLGNVELAAVSIQGSVIGLLAFGLLLGMGSALETLCGQAVGAGKLQMLGVYLQRSWLILLGTSVLLSFIYIFATPILKLLGQEDDVADLAGEFALWMLPQLFLYSLYFPMQKFLQAQSKLMAMAWIALVTLIIHAFLSWLLIFELGLGLVGAAITLHISWSLIDISQFLYIVYFFPDTWKGFSWLAFHDLWPFIRLSVASGVMLCLEIWYMMSLIIMTGNLKNATIEIDALSICMNLNAWEAMIFIGFNAAISVRVSNELGAGHPKAAKFAVLIVVLTSLSIGLICMAIILATKNDFAVLFTSSEVVMKAVSTMAMLLGVTMLLNSVQPVLSGVAVGGGWQSLIAYVNVGSYYCFGLPLGLLMGYKFDLGAKGIWTGMICGTALQTLILLLITYFTNWNREAAQAEDRMRIWGGSVEANTNRSLKGEENVEYENIP
ncbi:protein DETOXIFICATION 33 [Cryptomeria japonica]|uniref:protein DETOXIFICATION 33 n=1 Tax=Cryptomeria japonica TaxID=3369 RepID=UPI0027DA250A|nr:protein DETOXIFICATION 33 [Cryptomeria japonica]